MSFVILGKYALLVELQLSAAVDGDIFVVVVYSMKMEIFPWALSWFNIVVLCFGCVILAIFSCQFYWVGPMCTICTQP